jgi:nitronate monooxygenase
MTGLDADSTGRTRQRLRDLAPRRLVVSPMAGGPSTPELVVAAGGAGACAFLAGGYRRADALTEEIAAVRAGGVASFGVNLFVPGEPTADPGRVAAYVASLEPEARALGADVGEPTWDDDDYDAKVEVVLAEHPAVVSFTFGLPAVDVVRALQAAGSLVWCSVTTPEEAVLALQVGPNALCLQGAEAGAHRASLANDDRPDQDRPVRALLAAVRRRTLVPLVAAGGVTGPTDVTDLLRSGADLVQAGTVFLRCPESGAHPLYKEALGVRGGAAVPGSIGATAMTRAFSGRRARALVNTMTRDHHDAPPAYPEINNATRPLRAAAARAGDTAHMSLYAGTGFHAAPTRPAAEVVAWLASEVRP